MNEYIVAEMIEEINFENNSLFSKYEEKYHWKKLKTKVKNHPIAMRCF